MIIDQQTQCRPKLCIRWLASKAEEADERTMCSVNCARWLFTGGNGRKLGIVWEEACPQGKELHLLESLSQTPIDGYCRLAATRECYYSTNLERYRLHVSPVIPSSTNEAARLLDQ